MPHDRSLRVWHDMAQASATSDVVMGDKEKPEVYNIYNDTHVLDLGEPFQGKGGVDRVVENKVFDPTSESRPNASCGRRGHTHAFGNTEERAIWGNRGVRACEGACAWDHAHGGGRVAEHRGDYYDAIHVKRNEFWLILMEIFGGLAPEGVKLFDLYKQRAQSGVDRTEYVATDAAARKFAPHWAQLLSAAVVVGDAARSIRAVAKVRRDLVHRTPAPRAAARPARVEGAGA